MIVESSSGNMGIGLAQACCYHGLRMICVVDIKTARQNIQILRAYGAEIDMVTDPDPATGELLPARLDRVKELVETFPSAFWPNQYANACNSGAHYRTTMHEVATALGGKVDFVLCATSTCGTVRGCGEYVRDHGLATRVVAVDALGSLIFSDQQAKRLLPGMGAGVRPPLCDLRFIDDVVHVADGECVAGCRRLVRREGSSRGPRPAASWRRWRSCGIRSRPVPIACSSCRTGGSAISTRCYSDEWVQSHLGELPGASGPRGRV